MADDSTEAVELAVPTPQQVAWHDMELEMFVCLDPATWQGRQYDDHSTPLKAINPAKLDTEQWVEAAESFGAKQILFVAKHTGGFCWWQTDTSDYGIKETLWRGGKGDVVAELAESCRKRGMKLAIYVSPRDDSFNAANGGKCKTEQEQQRYNKIYRQQWTELLTRYGEISELWFDGSNVVPMNDIISKHAPKAIVFQGPNATIRWVGNESGYAPYPAWNAVEKTDALSGVATARHGDPNGKVWMPLEVDTTLREHYWFWTPNTEHKLKSLDHLMNLYERSVGHGAVLLLNSAPDTSGLIPQVDLKRYREFGAEIRRRFGRSLAETKGDGSILELDLGKPRTIDHVFAMENITHGERVREYVIDGFLVDQWQELCRGTAIGHKKIHQITPVKVSKIRFRAIQAAAKPLIRKLAVYYTTKPSSGVIKPDALPTYQKAGEWDLSLLKGGSATLEFDLSPYINHAAQYEVAFRNAEDTQDLTINSVMLFLRDVESPDFVEAIRGPSNRFNVNITEVPTGKKGSIVFQAVVHLGDNASSRGEVVIRSRR